MAFRLNFVQLWPPFEASASEAGAGVGEDATEGTEAVLAAAGVVRAPTRRPAPRFRCRKRELLDARWEHFDLERRNWLIPLSKSGKARHIPISDKALEVLQGLPR